MTYHVVKSAGALYVCLQDQGCIGTRKVVYVLLNHSCVKVEGTCNVDSKGDQCCCEAPDATEGINGGNTSWQGRGGVNGDPGVRRGYVKKAKPCVGQG